MLERELRDEDTNEGRGLATFPERACESFAEPGGRERTWNRVSVFPRMEKRERPAREMSPVRGLNRIAKLALDQKRLFDVTRGMAAVAEVHRFRFVGGAARVAAEAFRADDGDDGAIACGVGAFDRLLIAHGLLMISPPAMLALGLPLLIEPAGFVSCET